MSDPPAFTGSSHGTAVCGPACTVVWEGRSREASPYPDCSGSISEQRELTVRFDDERPSSRRLLFEPCPKNQGRSCATDCDHFVEWSGDRFLFELLIEYRRGRQ